MVSQGKEFKDRVALVTGGSRGIGRAVCLALAREGADIALNYVSNAEAAEQTQRDIEALGVRCTPCQADISDPNAVDPMVKDVVQTLDPIDLLVTAAGIAHFGDHSKVDFDLWQHIMKVNVDGTFLPIMAVKDSMIERGFGRIVCVASIAGLAPRGQMLPYSTSKAAVIAFARSCAQAFAPHVRVNSLAPGLIETDMTSDMAAEVKQSMRDQAFLRRTGQPEEMAETVLYLLSERSSFITGQTLVADGGRVTLP
ncbi:MAG: SDR family oxidoreductase [Alphaproteobacteria bacterium]|nr:SDR family oxidoreductase [Alphaproteobacteria bacterium]